MSTSSDPAFSNYIDGKFVPSVNGKRFTSVNPTTGQAWGTFADSDADDVDLAVRAAQAALQGP